MGYIQKFKSAVKPHQLVLVHDESSVQTSTAVIVCVEDGDVLSGRVVYPVPSTYLSAASISHPSLDVLIEIASEEGDRKRDLWTTSTKMHNYATLSQLHTLHPFLSMTMKMANICSHSLQTTSFRHEPSIPIAALIVSGALGGRSVGPQSQREPQNSDREAFSGAIRTIWVVTVAPNTANDNIVWFSPCWFLVAGLSRGHDVADVGRALNVERKIMGNRGLYSFILMRLLVFLEMLMRRFLERTSLGTVITVCWEYICMPSSVGNITLTIGSCDIRQLLLGNPHMLTNRLEHPYIKKHLQLKLCD
ncbi:hypothetical protein KCU77_g108, partial [Aureobasidium melanogenum]